MKISASFLSINDDLKNNLKKLDKTNIDYIHIDIMDGIFVNNETYSIDDIKYLTSGIFKPLDVHLMVKDVYHYVDLFSELNPEFITFHYEIVDDIDEMIDYIKNKKCKVGISIKPSTDINVLMPYIPKIDLVLIMSVEPGIGGQSFINSSVDKVKALSELKNKYNFVIEVDGGINNETIKLLNDADICVVGSYITSSNNYEEKVNELLEK